MALARETFVDSIALSDASYCKYLYLIGKDGVLTDVHISVSCYKRGPIQKRRM